jgi:hypothetical protein
MVGSFVWGYAMLILGADDAMIGELERANS